MNLLEMNYKERSELLMAKFSPLIGKSLLTTMLLTIQSLRNPVADIHVIHTHKKLWRVSVASLSRSPIPSL